MIKQELQQKLSQKLSFYQIQFIKLLEIPTTELVQRINQEIETNPLLDSSSDLPKDKDKDKDTSNDEEIRADSTKEYELDDIDNTPYYKYQTNNTSRDDQYKEIPVVSETTLIEHLEGQLMIKNLTDNQKLIIPFIIGNIDDSGYFRRDILSLCDDIAFNKNIEVPENEVIESLKIIQSLEPPGIGARGLQECLLIQLKSKAKTLNIDIAITILEHYFDKLSNKKYDIICKQLKINEEQLKDSIKEITKLNPKPGCSFFKGQQNKNIQVINPDFFLENMDGDLMLSLNNMNSPQLIINERYAKKLKNDAEREKETIKKEINNFVKQKVDSAKWFMDAIRERQTTLLFIMKKIVDYQREYFLTGDDASLKPMKLKDIAEITNFDISTISRVISGKTIQTEFGIFPIKVFFSESLETTSGEEVSTKEIKKVLQDLIEEENPKKPLTDDKLAELLNDKGYMISRRTVAKYREQLNIQVARLRKKL